MKPPSGSRTITIAMVHSTMRIATARAIATGTVVITVEQPTPSKQQVNGRILATTADKQITAKRFWLRMAFKSKKIFARSNGGIWPMMTVEDDVSCKIK